MEYRFLVSRADAQPCRSTDLYVSPGGGTSVQAGSVMLAWKPECLKDTSKIDLYLYSQQQSAAIPVHAWTGIRVADSRLNVTLDARWWNSTKDAKMNLQIVNHGRQPWDTSHPISHSWTVKNPGGSSGGEDATSSNLITPVTQDDSTLSSGSLAAAVICSVIGALILVIGGGIYFHRRQREKRIKEVEEMRARSMYSTSVNARSPPTNGAAAFNSEQPYTQDFANQADMAQMAQVDPMGQYDMQYPEYNYEEVTADQKEGEHQSMRSISDGASGNDGVVAAATGTETASATVSRRKTATERLHTNGRLDRWDSDFWFVQDEEPEVAPQEEQPEEPKEEVAEVAADTDSKRRNKRSREKGERRKKTDRVPPVKRKVSDPVDTVAVEEANARVAAREASKQRKKGSKRSPVVEQKPADDDAMLYAAIEPVYAPAYGELARAQAPSQLPSSIPASLLGPRVIPEPDWAPEPTGAAERDAKIASFLANLPRPGESYDGDSVVDRSATDARTEAHSTATHMDDFADAISHAHQD
ncbi:hypothetical protein MCUN1_001451 [Malassezia cuniculi]|uniref:Uncharacterized protein n=1 Tax=Malassezia cuniculi TaxID=948313 RepID=A0AAF0EST4_9BASI|nr:hypothetical protein MCUN1_001451 [Malassezia cuniculi]